MAGTSPRPAEAVRVLGAGVAAAGRKTQDVRGRGPGQTWPITRRGASRETALEHGPGLDGAECEHALTAAAGQTLTPSLSSRYQEREIRAARRRLHPRRRSAMLVSFAVGRAGRLWGGGGEGGMLETRSDGPPRSPTGRRRCAGRCSGRRDRASRGWQLYRAAADSQGADGATVVPCCLHGEGWGCGGDVCAGAQRWGRWGPDGRTWRSVGQRRCEARPLKRRLSELDVIMGLFGAAGGGGVCREVHEEAREERGGLLAICA